MKLIEIRGVHLTPDDVRRLYLQRMKQGHRGVISGNRLYSIFAGYVIVSNVMIQTQEIADAYNTLKV